MIKDIAALEGEDSSSDSDFESAVKKTVEGPLSKVVVGNKTVNTQNFSLDTEEKPLRWSLLYVLLWFQLSLWI